MVHVVALRPARFALPIFFNVDSAVGSNVPNANTDDVLLVQYFLSLQSFTWNGSPRPVPGQKLLVNGQMNTATIEAIQYFQQHNMIANPTSSRFTEDGVVSVAQNSYFHHGHIPYTIVGLNMSIKAQQDIHWPDISAMPGCPAQLQKAYRRAIGVSGAAAVHAGG